MGGRYGDASGTGAFVDIVESLLVLTDSGLQGLQFGTLFLQ